MTENNDFEDIERDNQRTSDKNKKSNASKFAVKPTPASFMWVLLFVLAVIIIVELFVLIKGNNRGNTGINPTDNPLLTVTQNPSQNDSDVTNVPVNTESATQTPTKEPEEQSTAPAVTTAPTNNPQGSTGVDLTAAQIIKPSDIDFSFLNNTSKEPFADAGKNADGTKSFDWYPGAVERLDDGTVNYKWDRYASTVECVEKYNGIYRKDDNGNNIVLTFDCGYEFEGNTGKILDTLKEKNAKAIFFITEGFLKDPKGPDLLKRMYNEGHLIGNHTANHKVMPTLSNEEFVTELNTVYQMCRDILGDSFTMAYYRPPQGASCERDLALAQYLGYNTTFWSFAHPDYNTSAQPDPAASLAKMKKQLHPGAVYLLHAISTTNETVLGEFIDYVRAEGFEVKRIDQA